MGTALNPGALFGMQHHSAARLGFEMDEVYRLASLAEIQVGGTSLGPQRERTGGDFPTLSGSSAPSLPACTLLLLLLG